VVEFLDRSCPGWTGRREQLPTHPAKAAGHRVQAIVQGRRKQRHGRSEAQGHHRAGPPGGSPETVRRRTVALIAGGPAAALYGGTRLAGPGSTLVGPAGGVVDAHLATNVPGVMRSARIAGPSFAHKAGGRRRRGSRRSSRGAAPACENTTGSESDLHLYPEVASVGNKKKLEEEDLQGGRHRL